MRMRALGRTGLSVTELALGTWGLSGDGYGAVSELDQERVIVRALALGIRVFDTADCWAFGAMESLLGRLLEHTKDTTVVTRLGTDREANPPRKRFDPEFLERSFDLSRSRLKRDVVDVVLLHNPSPAALVRGRASDYLKKLKAEGKVRAWGVSVTTLEAGKAALEQGAEVIALPYNALHGGLLMQLDADLERTGVGVLAHSLLFYGLLTGLWGPDRSFPLEDHRSDRWTYDGLRRRIRHLDALRPAVQGDVVSLRAVALRYVLASERVSCGVLGPRSTLQLDQLVREAGKGPPYLAPDALRALENRLVDVGARS